jgi:hypothetical protein
VVFSLQVFRTCPLQTPNIPRSISHIHFPLPGSFLRIRPNPSPCVTFRNKIFFFWGEELLAPRPTPTATAYSIYSQLHSFCPYLDVVFSISNRSPPHATMTQTAITWTRTRQQNKKRKDRKRKLITHGNKLFWIGFTWRSPPSVIYSAPRGHATLGRFATILCDWSGSPPKWLPDTVHWLHGPSPFRIFHRK